MDDRRGILRDELLIKIYILFVLREFRRSVPLELLTDVVLERISDYFEFITALGDLVLRGLVEHDGNYGISANGTDTLSAVESSLPYSTRLHTKETVEKLIVKLEREEAVFSRIEKTGGGYRVSMSLDTDVGRVLHMELLLPNEQTAKLVESAYLENAEKIYRLLISELTK